MTAAVGRGLAALAFLLCWLVCAAPVYAQDAVTVVGPFTGAKKEQLRAKVEDALLGSGTALGESSFSPAPDASEEAFVAAARKNNVKAFVTGHTDMAKKGWTLQLTVRSGKDGKVTGTKTISASWLPGLLTEIDEKAASQLAEPISKTALPAAAAATAEEATEETEKEEPEEKEEPQEEEAEEEETTPAPEEPGSPLLLGADFGAMSRSLAGADDRFATFAQQSHNGSMLLFSVYGAIYPGAFFTSGMLSNIGAVFAYESSIGGAANVGATSINTTASQLFVGGRLRIPFDNVEFGLGGAYLNHAFTFAFPDRATRQIPDISYDIVRLGGDVQVRLGNIGVGVDAGMRTVTSAGKQDGYIGAPTAVCRPDPVGCPYTYRLGFEGLYAGGFDVALAGRYFLTEFLAIKLGGEMRYYYYDFRFDSAMQQTLGNMAPPVLLQAVGGATDTYLLGKLGIEYHM